AVRVRETELQRLARVMQRRVNRLAAVRLQVLHHQVQQTVARLKSLPVLNQLQSRVEVTVLAQPPFHELRAELDLLEYRRVRLETYQRAVGFAAGLALLFLLEPALFERGFDEFTPAMAAHKKLLRQRVHRLGADAVQADAELKNVVVIFGAGVDPGHAIHHLAERDAAAEIANAHFRAVDADLHLLPVTHDVFIDGVVDDLLEQDVTTVIVVRAVAEPADVHPGPQPDMFERRQGLDLAPVVIVLSGARHTIAAWNGFQRATAATKRGADFSVRFANPTRKRNEKMWRPEATALERFSPIVIPCGGDCQPGNSVGATVR